MARYMIIERFEPDKLTPIYDRLNTNGRGLPEGLHFIDSWLTADNSCVYQLMETDNVALFDRWFEHWADLIDFEIVPLREKPSGAATS